MPYVEGKKARTVLEEVEKEVEKNWRSFSIDVSIQRVAGWGLWEGLREIIQNALDEHTRVEKVTGEKLSPPVIEIIDLDKRTAIKVRDFGDGMRHEHVKYWGKTYKEELEETRGIFGTGFKRAVMVFTREGWNVFVGSEVASFKDFNIRKGLAHNPEDAPDVVSFSEYNDPENPNPPLAENGTYVFLVTENRHEAEELVGNIDEKIIGLDESKYTESDNLKTVVASIILENNNYVRDLLFRKDLYLNESSNESSGLGKKTMFSYNLRKSYSREKIIDEGGDPLLQSDAREAVKTSKFIKVIRSFINEILKDFSSSARFSLEKYGDLSKLRGGEVEQHDFFHKYMETLLDPEYYEREIGLPTTHVTTRSKRRLLIIKSVAETLGERAGKPVVIKTEEFLVDQVPSGFKLLDFGDQATKSIRIMAGKVDAEWLEEKAIPLDTVVLTEAKKLDYDKYDLTEEERNLLSNSLKIIEEATAVPLHNDLNILLDHFGTNFIIKGKSTQQERDLEHVGGVAMKGTGGAERIYIKKNRLTGDRPKIKLLEVLIHEYGHTKKFEDHEVLGEYAGYDHGRYGNPFSRYLGLMCSLIAKSCDKISKKELMEGASIG